jgi:cobyrinic acid a,c-diamide synthase
MAEGSNGKPKTELLDQLEKGPWPSFGSVLRGHEFHCSRIVPQSDWTANACAVRRGTGCFHGRDAAILRNV